MKKYIKASHNLPKGYKFVTTQEAEDLGFEVTEYEAEAQSIFDEYEMKLVGYAYSENDDFLYFVVKEDGDPRERVVDITHGRVYDVDDDEEL